MKKKGKKFQAGGAESRKAKTEKQKEMGSKGGPKGKNQKLLEEKTPYSTLKNHHIEKRRSHIEGNLGGRIDMKNERGKKLNGWTEMKREGKGGIRARVTLTYLPRELC